MNVRTALALWCPDWTRARRDRITRLGLGNVNVWFDGDLRTTLGVATVLTGCVARRETAHIALHPKLLLEEVYHPRLILLHELSHLIVGVGHHHDRVWKAEAERLGTPPTALYPYADLLEHCPLRKAWTESVPASATCVGRVCQTQHPEITGVCRVCHSIR